MRPIFFSGGGEPEKIILNLKFHFEPGHSAEIFADPPVISPAGPSSLMPPG